VGRIYQPRQYPRREYERKGSRKRQNVKQPYTELIERRDADPHYTPTKHRQ
jgi:hypothetical protein